MQEILFSDSPIATGLSAVALLLTFLLPYILGQKTGLKQFPKAIYQLMLVCTYWNTLSLVGSLFFSGPEFGTAAKIIFGVQALAWVQAGNAIYHIAEHALHFRRFNFWRLLNAIGGTSVIVVTAIFCVNESLFTEFQIFGLTPLHDHPYFKIYSLLFFLYVFPEFLLTIFKLMRNTLQTGDKDAVQINFYMAGSFIFFFAIAFIFDFMIPVASGFNVNGRHPIFLQWHQYSCIFLAVLCGQYFTSISFKNKSSHWLMKNLFNQLGDCIFSIQDNGKISYCNPAAQLLFRKTDNEMKMSHIQDFIPSLKLDNEVVTESVKVQVNDELHSFSLSLFKYRTTLTTYMWLLLLSDQTNSLFYQQRIKTLNRQFADYKQDLIRYQDRLDSSEKKFKEQSSFSSTLINALPFQFWSKNEQGVYTTQNIMDIKSRGNLIQTTDNTETISDKELQARNNGLSSIFTTFENDHHEKISEDEANNLIFNNKTVHIYNEQFIPIISDQKPYKIIGLKQDITEQKRLERERDMLSEQKRIHSRLEDLGTMLGGFAHDYKNSIGAQIGFCELARETLENLPTDDIPEKKAKTIAKAGELIGEANKAANKAKDSVNQLLSAIRNEASIAPKPMVFSPFLIIEDVVKKVQLTLPSNIHISTEEIDKDLKIKCLPAALDRILSNLANNAIFAMKDDGGTLTFKLERVEVKTRIVQPFSDTIEPGTYAKFTIADTGTGIDSGTLERIFSPFFTTKAPGEGLGLGLTSALRLLKDGNAHFTVHTTLGEGTQFNLYWDLATEKTEDA